MNQFPRKIVDAHMACCALTTAEQDQDDGMPAWNGGKSRLTSVILRHRRRRWKGGGWLEARCQARECSAAENWPIRKQKGKGRRAEATRLTKKAPAARKGLETDTKHLHSQSSPSLKAVAVMSEALPAGSVGLQLAPSWPVPRPEAFSLGVHPPFPQPIRRNARKKVQKREDPQKTGTPSSSVAAHGPGALQQFRYGWSHGKDVRMQEQGARGGKYIPYSSPPPEKWHPRRSRPEDWCQRTE
ncbi:hypothetical protein LZ30DRAFT_471015 [Colletotrichum cereale]|nr:hypothetical protein LZ30DRAFT_471015 [Colletotrichum cereale]